MEFDTDKFSTRNLFMLHVDTDWSQVDINELHLSIIKRCYFIYEDFRPTCFDVSPTSLAQQALHIPK